MSSPTGHELPLGDDIFKRTFTPRGKNAYDKAEVDAFMSALAKELNARLYDRIGRIGDEIATVLQAAEDVATKLKLEAHEEASATLRNATLKAAQLVSEAESYAKEQREVTERRCVEQLREAAATLRASKQLAERLINDAETYALRLTESAERQLGTLERHKHAVIERMNIVANTVHELQTELAKDESLGDKEKRRPSSAPGRPELAVIDLRSDEKDSTENATEAFGQASQE